MNEHARAAAAALEKNGFKVYSAADCGEARSLFWERIFPGVAPRTVAWGDSLTLEAVGLVPDLKARKDISLIETFGPGLSWDEKIERRRQALGVDLFITGTNAVTEGGELVNLDMIGNRTGGISFGPRAVAIFVGANKVVPTVEAAMDRVKRISAPRNAKRHATFRTPCQVTGACSNCSSPDRICNTWSIVEKCFPKGRISVVLIDEELGL